MTLLRLHLDAHPKLADLRAEVEDGHAADMDALFRASPEARFIHIIRDGRDVAASLRGLPSAPGDGGIAAIAALWRDTIWRARRAAAHLPHYTEVRYEALVSEPERVLRELCSVPRARVCPRDAPIAARPTASAAGGRP